MNTLLVVEGTGSVVVGMVVVMVAVEVVAVVVAAVVAVVVASAVMTAVGCPKFLTKYLLYVVHMIHTDIIIRRGLLRTRGVKDAMLVKDQEVALAKVILSGADGNIE